MKLLIATTNQGKKGMFQGLLKGIGVELVFLDALDQAIGAPEENGMNPEENAILKARYYCQKTGLTTLADDAEFCIDDLDGEPGIMARRWGGRLPDTVSDEDWLDFFLERVKGVPKETLPASFPFARCVAFPDGTSFIQEDKVEFLLTKNPRKPYKAGWPISSVRVFLDGRHELDVPADDPLWDEQLKKEGLIDLLRRAGLVEG
ncbi:hypothetical protein HZA44_04360 [Candidatus Peregrinibacteria bacterium]|nr:hypothetical protein [Candidatus Peregrinibacteria bacterium]